MFKDQIILLFACVGFFCICALIYVLIQLAFLLKEKRLKTSNETDKILYETAIMKTGNNHNLEYMVKTTDDLLNFATGLVEDDLLNFSQSLLILNHRYDVKNLDNDIKEISEHVYHALKSNLFLSNEIIITDEFLMEYIVRYTTMRLISIVNTINNTLDISGSVS